MITEIAKEMKSKMNQMANMIVESERCGTTKYYTERVRLSTLYRVLYGMPNLSIIHRALDTATASIKHMRVADTGVGPSILRFSIHEPSMLVLLPPAVSAPRC
jgi:hypothetical protein